MIARTPWTPNSIGSPRATSRAGALPFAIATLRFGVWFDFAGDPVEEGTGSAVDADRITCEILSSAVFAVDETRGNEIDGARFAQRDFNASRARSVSSRAFFIEEPSFAPPFDAGGE